MVYKSHYIEIYVNGKLLELESQDSLNLRFQSTIYNPEKISSTQTEYSFEFEIPSTPNNDKIFDYANNLSKINKFRSRFNAEVYGDGILIFEGTLILNGFKEKKYYCNLVSVKVYSLEEIFGDAVLTDVPWSIDFEGAGGSANTINHYNMADSKVKFPFISYGAFQKTPYNSDEVANDYTSKYDIDKYNRWYVESFAPSINLLEYIKRSFNWKGYTVGGDVFKNPILSKIYMSTNLADGQSPEYNVGNPKFGAVELTTSLTTTANDAYGQELNFPYYKISAKESTTTYDVAEEYNFKDIEAYDLLKGDVTVARPSYMYQPDEHIIVIPADGFYKIEMTVNSSLNTNTQIIAAQYTRHNQAEEELNEEDLQLTPGLTEITPLEIHLVRNYDDNIELIKGKNNTSYVDGNPNNRIAWDRYENQRNWQTCYPHEDPYNSTLPSEKNDLTFRNTNNRMGGQRETATDSSNSNRMGGQRTRGSSFEGDRVWSYNDYGYIYNDGEIMAYDPAVSEAFICGFSSMKGGVVSVMKNGYSWSKSNSTKNEAFYPEIGYSKLYREAGTGNLVTEQTRFNENTYINTPISRINVTDNNMTGYLSCMVYLRRNDILQLYAVHRGYLTGFPMAV